jgi:hypothetical protein
VTNYHEHATREADQKFFEKARKISPAFPDIETVLERRRCAQEALAARILMGLAVIFGIATPFAEQRGFMLLAAFACFTGFVITCFVAGNRQFKRNGNSGGHPDDYQW